MATNTERLRSVMAACERIQGHGLDMTTLDDRQALCEQDVTLNGEPARITGYRKAFAVVRQTRTGLSAEWAWPTVARIVANGGNFQS